MLIKQTANSTFTIQRLDTGTDITFNPGDIIDVDSATAAYLLSAKQYDMSGNIATEFVEA